MKKNKARIGCLMACAVVVIVLIIGLRSCIHTLSSDSGVSFTLNSQTLATRTVLHNVEQLGEWEFLSIEDEVMIDTTRSRFLAQDDEFVRIYHGTLRLGIDMNECTRHWATFHGDTLCLSLPPIRLLDPNFIDEARTRSFYQQGEWDGQTREDLYRRAHHAMIQRCMTPSNLKIAKENAIQQIKALFHTLDYTKVEVVIN